MPILDKLKIHDASPHTFRHTFASHLVIVGVSIYVVKELLRHASVKETEIYAHLAKETTRSAVEKLNEKMRSITAGTRDTVQTSESRLGPQNVLPFVGRG